MNFLSGFFDYTAKLTEGGKDYDTMATPFLIFTFVSIPVICFLLRKKSKDWMTKYFKIVSIVWMCLEFFKILWESYYDIRLGRGFNSEGLLSLETCSLFMLVTHYLGFGKNEKVKDLCAAWLPTMGVIAGLTNVVIPRGLKWFPFWNYGCIHSLAYHYMMVLSGILIIVTGYKRFEFKDILKSFLIEVIMSLPVVAIDYCMKWNYMQFLDASDYPIVNKLVEKISGTDLAFLNTFIVYGVFLLLTSVFGSIYSLIEILRKKKANKTL